MSLEISIQLFHFLYLFPIFFFVFFVNVYVVNAVSGHCNASFFALFDVVFESLYLCIDAIFNAGEFSFSFFS